MPSTAPATRKTEVTAVGRAALGQNNQLWRDLRMGASASRAKQREPGGRPRSFPLEIPKKKRYPRLFRFSGLQERLALKVAAMWRQSWGVAALRP